MKYMGHKGKLLPILGDILKHESKNSAQIADPFCGSAAVSWFLAKETESRVISGDLQSFAVARAAAVIERIGPLDPSKLLASWFELAKKISGSAVSFFPNAERSVSPDATTFKEISDTVKRSRTFCEQVIPSISQKINASFPMTLAYGGHYFSPLQSIQLDALRQTIPADPIERKICIAALIDTASKCAAAPGHTAQPFQPTPTASRYIAEAWTRDVWNLTEQAVKVIALNSANIEGRAQVGDYKQLIKSLNPGDLVFADPPYSDVHYSRFYHVLETLARGSMIQVSGIGRYPNISERPSSEFSQRGKARAAAHSLIDSCISQKVNLVLTFPSAKSSNGLRSEDFVDYGREKFSSISCEIVDSTFSTLGGSAINRGGRQIRKESIVSFRV